MKMSLAQAMKYVEAGRRVRRAVWAESAPWLGEDPAEMEDLLATDWVVEPLAHHATTVTATPPAGLVALPAPRLSEEQTKLKHILTTHLGPISAKKLFEIFREIGL